MIMNNVVHRCDCMDLMKDKPDKFYDLAIVDPPYNIGKAKWDNIDNYINWIIVIMKEIQRVTKDNGSVYFFHNDFNQLAEIQTRIKNETNFILRQFIVWNKRFIGSPLKGYLDGYVCEENLRNYQKLAEYICFYTFQDSTGLSKVMGNCVYPIRDYIRNEIIKAKGKIVLKEINNILGTANNGGGVASAILSLKKTVPAFITEIHYNKLKKWLNKKEYKYLRKEYKYLRKEYEDLRYYFNNQKTHHSVWNYDIDSDNIHPTIKPKMLILNILKHSMRPNGILFEPFTGSGKTRILCYDLNIKYEGCELDKDYWQAQEERFQNHIAQPEIFDKQEIQKNIFQEQKIDL